MRVSINLHPEALVNILQDERIRYINLHDRLRAGAVLSYDRESATKRRGVDNLVFGSDGEELNYGALNLGNIGLYSYGAVCVLLRHREIKARTSFMEDNSFSYVNGSLPSVTLNVPAGVRALWNTAPILAVLKHASDLLKRKRWRSAELADLVLRSRGEKKTDRFIEAQVFPPIALRSFETIVYDPALGRPVGPKSIVGETSELSRKMMGEYLSSLDLRGIEVRVLKRDAKGGPSR